MSVRVGSSTQGNERRPSPSFAGRVVLLVVGVTLVLGIFVEISASLWVAALLLSSFAVSWVVGRAIQQVSVEPAPPTIMIEGEVHESEVTLVNGSVLPMLGLTVWARAVGLQGRGATLVLGDAPQRVPLAIRATRRGHTDRWTLQLETRGPMGLLVHTTTRDVSADLLVLPKSLSVPANVLRELERRAELAFEVPQPTAAGEGEFYALRELRPGEPERRVHPRLSARLGRKMHQEYRGGRAAPVRLFVDGRLPQRHAGSLSADFEDAVRFVAGLIRALAARGSRLELWQWERGGFVLRCQEERLVEKYLASLAHLKVERSVDPVTPPPTFSAEERGVHCVLHAGLTQVPSDWIDWCVGSPSLDSLLERGRRR